MGKISDTISWSGWVLSVVRPMTESSVIVDRIRIWRGLRVGVFDRRRGSSGVGTTVPGVHCGPDDGGKMVDVILAASAGSDPIKRVNFTVMFLDEFGKRGGVSGPRPIGEKAEAVGVVGTAGDVEEGGATSPPAVAEEGAEGIGSSSMSS